jgi:hypothetical protein
MFCARLASINVWIEALDPGVPGSESKPISNALDCLGPHPHSLSHTRSLSLADSVVHTLLVGIRRCRCCSAKQLLQLLSRNRRSIDRESRHLWCLPYRSD